MPSTRPGATTVGPVPGPAEALPVVPPVVAPVIVPPMMPIVEPEPESVPQPGPEAAPTPRRPEPAAVVDLAAGAPPAMFRAGYTDYLRTASTREIAAVALPGVAGMMALTGLGGLLGYRQAKAGQSVRVDATRFMR